MPLPPPKVCQRIRKLHAMVGSSSPKEAHNAHDKLNHLLAEHGLTWNDLPRILTADGDTGEVRDAGTGAAVPRSASPLRYGFCIVGCSIVLLLRRGSP
jgi:hypothetical protein